ncbi:mechanosensitive ion channel family protein [Thermithiobacillus tepidarius DSM 3134]|uniref:mechanosensitive ion channel family protein n=1 Tax=Thermithiobacillus tepidarius TaxID=929 RepID=UPI000414D718|nr:mechanosensitive ion channel family protein [Thermithiobacillus tepidarius]
MNLDMTDALIAVQDMLNGFIERLPYIVVALLVFALFYLAGRTVRHGIRRFSARRHRHRNLGLVLGRLAQALIIFVGTLVALVIVLPSFRPGQLVQLLGIGSVAIGFAFRDILQNFMAGILLLLHEPFRIGDQIRVAAFEGVVEDIQTRATMIRTYDGRRIVIPNAKLFTDAVIVNTAYAQRRLEYELGIGYGDDIEDAKALMLQAVQEVPGVLAEPAPDVLVVGLAGSAIKLRVRWWIEPPRQADALDAQDQVLAAIRRALGEHGIDLPFETRVLLFHDQTESSDGDRRRQREGWPAGPGEAPHARTIAGAIQQLAQAVARSGSNAGGAQPDRRRNADEQP